MSCRNKYWYKKRGGAETQRQKYACEEGEGEQCLLCGNWYKDLAPHLRQTHHMSQSDYYHLFIN